VSEGGNYMADKNGKIVVLGEPMGLFMADEPGKLSEISKFTASIAGAEYNVAIGLSRLGQKVLYITKLGEDTIGDRIIDGLVKNGISSEMVLRSKTSQTGFMMKELTDNGDPAISYFRKNSAASTIDTHDIDKLDLYQCSFLHVTGIFPAISDSALNAVNRLISRVKALDMTISFDPNIRRQLWRDEKTMIRVLNDIASKADIVLPGIGEGKILTGMEKPEEICGFYHTLGVKNVIVKLGAKGAYYSGLKDEGYVKPFLVKKIIDTVGAGDGFAAGVISALAEGLSLKEAAERGNVIGAIQLTNRSDNEGLPTKQQLNEIIKNGYV
jgi:sugar/nucleoside kinase (ribokinase family)